MTLSRSLGAVLTFCLLFMLPAAVASEAPAQTDEARILYDQGDYAGAYKHYLKRAKKGDVFARYRVSYMHAMGLGAKYDPVESLAWAVLATANSTAGLGRYQDAVAALVPEKDRRKAQKTTDNYRRRFDRQSYSNNTALSGGGCTGSRLSSNCGKSTSAGGPRIPWGDDLSGDPEQRRRIEELNRSILEEAFQIEPASPAD